MKSITLKVAVALFALTLTPIASANDATAYSPPDVGNTILDDVGGGAMAGARRALSPRLQAQADYSGAETNWFNAYYRGNRGTWKYKVEWPNLVIMNPGGSRAVVGYWTAAGAYKKTGTSWKHMPTPGLNGISHSGSGGNDHYIKQYMLVGMTGTDSKVGSAKCGTTTQYGYPMTTCTKSSNSYWIK
jgi:hypothetical protein